MFVRARGVDVEGGPFALDSLRPSAARAFLEQLPKQALEPAPGSLPVVEQRRPVVGCRQRRLKVQRAALLVEDGIVAGGVVHQVGRERAVHARDIPRFERAGGVHGRDRRKAAGDVDERGGESVGGRRQRDELVEFHVPSGDGDRRHASFPVAWQQPREERGEDVGLKHRDVLRRKPGGLHRPEHPLDERSRILAVCRQHAETIHHVALQHAIEVRTVHMVREPASVHVASGKGGSARKLSTRGPFPVARRDAPPEGRFAMTRTVH